MKKRDQRGVSRRGFLRGVAAGAALYPFVPILNASAQEMRFPKRLLLIYTPDGTADGYGDNGPIDWRPTGSETSFTLQRTHEPLAAHQADILIPWGLRMSARGAGEAHAYGMGGLWTGSFVHEPHEGADFDGGNGARTGWGSGPSVDQVVARAYGAAAPYLRAVDDPNPETPFRSIELGVQCGDPHIVSRCIYRGDKQPLHPEVDPGQAFRRYFASVLGDAQALARIQARRQSVLDVLRRDLDRLRRRVSAEEYLKIDAHAEGLRAIERQLAGGAVACAAPSEPEDGDWHTRNEDFPRASQTMIDITVRALACDLTRVASVQLSRGFSGVVHEWIGKTDGHHSMSHDTTTDRRNDLVDVGRWYSEQVAYLLTSLKAVPEGDGTLLDNTLVVWGRELGTCRHRMQPWPVVLAGRAQGAIQPGRFLDRSDEVHAKLLVSICRAMGLDVSSFGNVHPDSGPLDGVA